MEHKKFFDASGILLVISGALMLFYWVISFVEGFGAESIIPTYKTLIAGGIMGVIKNFIITATTVIFSIGLIFSGLVIIKIPKIIGAGPTGGSDLEERMNRLQSLVWKVLHYVKSKEGK